MVQVNALKMFRSGVFIFSLTALVQVFAIDEFKLVRTDLGDVRGNILETILNKRSFYAFRGIRYGKAPLGALRFKVICLIIALPLSFLFIECQFTC